MEGGGGGSRDSKRCVAPCQIRHIDPPSCQEEVDLDNGYQYSIQLERPR